MKIEYFPSMNLPILDGRFAVNSEPLTTQQTIWTDSSRVESQKHSRIILVVSKKEQQRNVIDIIKKQNTPPNYHFTVVNCRKQATELAGLLEENPQISSTGIYEEERAIELLRKLFEP